MVLSGPREKTYFDSSSSELTEVWVAIEDKLEVSTIKDAISSTQLLDSLPANHLIGNKYHHRNALKSYIKVDWMDGRILLRKLVLLEHPAVLIMIKALNVLKHNLIHITSKD